jgi:CheY-like chemotaxis protein
MIDSEPHYGRGCLTLVVDDDPRIRGYIKTILRSANVQILEAGDGSEALELFRVWRGKIDLVITDIRMPRMTGTDLATSLRSDCPNMPVIFVSAEPAAAFTEFQNNQTVFIEKPFGPRALLEAARRFFDFIPAAC